MYPSYFKLHLCWLHSLTRITYLSKLIGIHSLAASMQLELFRVYTGGAKLITASEKIALECNATHAIAAKVASMVVIGHGFVLAIVGLRYSLACATSHC